MFWQRELWIYKAQSATLVTSTLLFTLFSFLSTLILSIKDAEKLYSLFILLSGFLANDLLFEVDSRTGFLDTIWCTQRQFFTFVIQKLCMFWGLLGLPLSFVSILLTILCHPEQFISSNILAPLLSSLIGFSIIMLCSALFSGTQKNKGLLFFIGLPLYFPTFLIHNTLMHSQFPTNSDVLPLVGLGLIMVPLCLIVSSYCLRIATEE